MITLELKPCCYKCECPDIEVENYDFPAGYLNGQLFILPNTNATIYCTHARVCKNYIESTDD